MAPSFSQRVYDLVFTIPPGCVTTYGLLARAAGGGPMAARSITGILTRAPNQSSIPYHRIVYANGTAWLPTGSKDKKERRDLYAAEDITVDDTGKIYDFEEILFDFS